LQREPRQGDLRDAGQGARNYVSTSAYAERLEAAHNGDFRAFQSPARNTPASRRLEVREPSVTRPETSDIVSVITNTPSHLIADAAAAESLAPVSGR
jgi:hypothetical protein